MLYVWMDVGLVGSKFDLLMTRNIQKSYLTSQVIEPIKPIKFLETVESVKLIH